MSLLEDGFEDSGMLAWEPRAWTAVPVFFAIQGAIGFEEPDLDPFERAVFETADISLQSAAPPVALLSDSFTILGQVC